jgi:ataxin-3
MFEIELIPYASQDSTAKQARDSPESIQAYICNLGLHWFTIRRFGREYFDLNSFYYVPEFLSYMMLPAYFNLIQEKGYSVFIVHGTLPECIADRKLTEKPINQTEYRLLTEGLPKLIMDEKLKGNFKNLDKRGNLVVSLPQHLFEEFRKNPNNSDIRQKINAFLPEGVTIEDLPELAGRSKSSIDAQMFGNCNCPHHRRRPQVLTEPLASHMIDDPSKLQQQSTMITRHVTQYIIEEPNQHRLIASEILVMSQSTDRDSTSLDNHDVQRMTKASTGLQYQEDELLQHVMALSLLSKPGMSDDKDLFLREDPCERMNQQLLDEAIAASLTSNDFALKQFDEASESIPITTRNSESASIRNPSSSSPTDTYSLPLKDAHSSPSLKDIYASPPTDMDSLPPKDLHSSTPIDTQSPPPEDVHSLPQKDTYSPPPTNTYSFPQKLVDQDYIISPSIEGKLFETLLR